MSTEATEKSIFRVLFYLKECPEKRWKGYGYVPNYRKRQTVCIRHQAGYFGNKFGFEVWQVLGKNEEAQDVNSKLDKIRLGIEECYSKILKKRGNGKQC